MELSYALFCTKTNSWISTCLFFNFGQRSGLPKLWVNYVILWLFDFHDWQHECWWWAAMRFFFSGTCAVFRHKQAWNCCSSRVPWAPLGCPTLHPGHAHNIGFLRDLANDWRHSWCTYDAFVGVRMTSLPVFSQTFGYPTLYLHNSFYIN